MRIKITKDGLSYAPWRAVRGDFKHREHGSAMQIFKTWTEAIDAVSDPGSWLNECR